jgi:hypothetical protein
LSKTTNFDAFSHHPYGIRGPLSHALNPDDAAVPDLGKIRGVVRAAERNGTISGERKPLWVTEMSWDSRPADPQGVPEATHARWLEEALWILWKQGVSTVTWFLVRDQPKGPGYEFGNQSGVYLFDGAPKQAATAFSFPFVVERRKGADQIWGMAPSRVRTTVQRRVGTTWRTVAVVTPRGDRTFVAGTSASRGWHYRAVAAGRTSLTWTVR